VVGPGSRINIVDIRHLEGAFSRAPAIPNAVGARDAAFALFGLTIVPPGEHVATYAASGRELIQALGPWPNETGNPSFLAPADATEHGTRQAYDREVYHQLQTVKANYDPRNRFRLNHNIPPRSAA
jgi:hypothetical protein